MSFFHLFIFVLIAGFLGVFFYLFFLRDNLGKGRQFVERRVGTVLEEADRYIERAKRNHTRPEQRLKDFKEALHIVERALGDGVDHAKLHSLQRELVKRIGMETGIDAEQLRPDLFARPDPDVEVAPRPTDTIVPDAPEPEPAPEPKKAQQPKQPAPPRLKRSTLDVLLGRKGRKSALPKGYRPKRPAVLVVHSDAAERADLAEMVQEIDPAMDVVQLDSTGDVLETIKRGRIDIVVSGIKMGKVNGLHMLVEMKKACPWVEVIVVSWIAYLHQEDGRRLGAYDVLDKPVKTSVFRETVRRCIVERVATNEWRKKVRNADG